MPDAHANFAISQVATAPSPALSGTSLTVQAGHGARFPSTPFNAPVWPNGVLATPLNAEIVRVTLIAGDVLTIARAQEGSSARAIAIGDQIMAGITAKTLTDVELTPVQPSADYTAAGGQCVLMTGAHTITLPTLQRNGTLINIVALSGIVTIIPTGGSGDGILTRGSATPRSSISIPAGTSLLLQWSDVVGTGWFIVDGAGQTITPTPWIAPSLLNSWANFGGAGIATAGYMKDPLGFVAMKGRVKSGTSATIICNLPAGYRPGATDYYPLAMGAVTMGAGVIGSNGDLSVYFPGGGAAVDISLAGIRFLAEN